MRLPAITTPMMMWLTTKQSEAVRNGTKVLSIIDKHNCYQLITQGDDTKQPTWSLSGINSLPTLVFSGSEYLQCNAAGANVSNSDFTLFMVSSASAISGSYTHAVSLGNSAGNAEATIAFGSDSVDLVVTNDANSGFDSSTAEDGKVHVYTMLKSGDTFLLRRDGVEIISSTNTGVHTFDNICVGATNVNGSVSFNFKGSMTTMVLYKGAVSELSPVENYLMVEAGLKSSF